MAQSVMLDYRQRVDHDIEESFSVCRYALRFQGRKDEIPKIDKPALVGSQNLKPTKLLLWSCIILALTSSHCAYCF